MIARMHPQIRKHSRASIRILNFMYNDTWNKIKCKQVAGLCIDGNLLYDPSTFNCVRQPWHYAEQEIESSLDPVPP